MAINGHAAHACDSSFGHKHHSSLVKESATIFHCYFENSDLEMRTLIIFSLAIFCTSSLTGCATPILGDPNCVKIALAYSGEVKPIENVGVVIFDRFATAVQIDGQYKHKLRIYSASCGALQGANLNEQIHLAPGTHLLQLAYAEGANGSFTKSWTPVAIQLSAGDVVQIKSVLNENRTRVSFVTNPVPDQKDFLVQKFNEALATTKR